MVKLIYRYSRKTKKIPIWSILVIIVLFFTFDWFMINYIAYTLTCPLNLKESSNFGLYKK